RERLFLCRRSRETQPARSLKPACANGQMPEHLDVPRANTSASGASHCTTEGFPVDGLGKPPLTYSTPRWWAHGASARGMNYARRILGKVKGQEGNCGCGRRGHEEWPKGDQRPLPNLWDRHVQDFGRKGVNASRQQPSARRRSRPHDSSQLIRPYVSATGLC